MIKIFKQFNKKDWALVFAVAILIVFQVWLDLKLPDYMSEITRILQSEGYIIKDILVQGGYMLLCAFGSLGSAVIVGYITSFISADFSMNLRRRIFKKVEDFGMPEIKKFETSSLITRTTNDVTQLEMLVAMGMQLIIKAPVMCIWAITKIINKNIEWSLLVLAGVALLLVTIGILLKIVYPRFEKVQKLIDGVNGVTRESVTGIRVVRAFNAEEYQENRFDKVNNDLTNMQLFNQKCFAILDPVMNIVMHFLTLGIYFIGAYLIDAAHMVDKITLFSNMVVFSSYGMQVIMSFLMLAMIFMILPRASVSAKRINEVLDEELSLKDGTLDGNEALEVGTAEFKNVSFKYPDASEYVLKDISFKVNKGETVAFIGSTGSGKSTLINLIPRFYDATEGEVLIDGINIRDYKLKELHNKIGYVPQKAVMFIGSVKSNVGYGSVNGTKPTLGKIKEATDVAQASSFIKEMDGEYEAHIAQGGTNVSGGQKQRLSIARAIARDPEIYIFDDSFSALDFKTDATLRRALKEYTKDATSIIVAQRVGTIINADKIVVLNEGECVGIGTHKELLKSCKVYQEIVLSQLSKEELENA
ncbi:MAG: ABC transporter ATP-binding protein [Bacilli bacterium]